MKKFYLPRLLLALILVTGFPFHAHGWNMGFGLELVEVGDELSDIDLGLGLAVELGLDLSESAELKVGVGSSVHDEDGVDLTYSRFWIGPRFYFNTGGLTPWLEAGFMSHLIDYDLTVYEIDGAGLYFGGGFQWVLTPGSALGFHLKHTAWEGEGNSGLINDRGDVTTTLIGASYTVQF